MQKDQEGDAGQRAKAARGGPRARVWVTLVVVALAGLEAASLSWSSSGAQTVGQLSAGAGSRGILASSSDLPVTPRTPPAPPTLAAPGTLVNGGADQSDPFLTVASGHFLLLTSGGTGSRTVNVPIVTSTDFVHWSDPTDALSVLPAWAQPGFTWAPDLHRFGSRYGLYFTAMVRNYAHQIQCISSAFASSPTGPFTAQPLPIICQVDQGDRSIPGYS